MRPRKELELVGRPLPTASSRSDRSGRTQVDIQPSSGEHDQKNRRQVHLRTSPVFIDHRTRSISSKSILISEANWRSFSSTVRYLERVEGGFASSIIFSSSRHLKTCLSSIA